VAIVAGLPVAAPRGRRAGDAAASTPDSLPLERGGTDAVRTTVPGMTARRAGPYPVNEGARAGRRDGRRFAGLWCFGFFFFVVGFLAAAVLKQPVSWRVT
jgi:hypothetical protein